MNDEQMAMYRVKGKGNIPYMEKEFDSDEINARRSYMRRILRGTAFDNNSNDTLDGMRIWPERINNGYFVEDTNGYEFILPSKKMTTQETEFRRLRSMMPPEYINLIATDFKWEIYQIDATKEMDTVNKFIVNYEEFKRNGMGLYIFSTTKGSGKTMLSCCLLNELSKRYIGSVKFINALDFLEVTKKGFNYDNPDIEALYMAAVLVIDDIGVQLDKEWVNTVFYRLINDRYNNRKVTIYTSNKAINDLKMDDRIIDRIEATSIEVHLPEVSIRRQVRQVEKDRLLNGTNKKSSQVQQYERGQVIAGQTSLRTNTY